ncbi:S-layer homology domain-containing protein [Paenibacillus sp. UNCCL117]|uniref:Ig-like domain-containing protein n=1 Tax=Paenibacillus sp. UNCCL117 TaxID=1502764 RepID=UPI0009086AC6|nr:S-layer homology domain-containing protein [Paenibacillus sp. UNCCL117]SFW45650.1 S-layer homology domain-containing protein [Paenibacillus sp. UNCCL117]
MNQEWNKWLLSAVLLSMAMGTTAVGAADTTVQPAQAAIMFSDRASISDARRAAVEEAVKQGLLSGYPDASFRPNQLLTRQELGVLLAKALRLEPKQGAGSTFADLKDNWAAPYIEALVDAGFIDSEGTYAYRPLDPVTREELAAVFVRAVNGVDAKGGQDKLISDSGDISPWAEQSVNNALRLGLMNASGDAFEPRGTLERQDIAEYLLDIFKTQERTATIERIDGDIVVIDGKPYLISGQLKELLGERNREALEGAVLTYKSVNHNVNDLQRIEIKKSGTEGKPVQLDLGGMPFRGELAIAADHIAVKGDSLAQVVLMPGAGQLELHSKVAQIIVETGKPVKLDGSGAWGELRISNPEASLSLGKTVSINKLELPEGAPANKLIANFNEIKNQISQTPADAGTQASAGPQGSSGSTSGSTDSSDSSSDSNHAPTVVNALSDVTQVITDGPKVVSLAGVFADTDDDALTLTVVSSNTGVATVSISGTTLTITPLNTGATTVTVTASDGNGGTVQATLVATFTAPVPVNNAPTVANVLSDFSQVVTDGPKVMSLAGVFADTDDDALTLTVVSSNTGVAKVSISGTTLTITPLNTGATTVTVTASDGNGGTVQATLVATFTAPVPVNHAPTVANALSDFSQVVTDGPKVVSLANVFADADGDALTLTATSSDPGVATVSITGTDLTITPLNAGATTVTVTANDGNGGTVQATLTTTFTAPVSVNNAPTVANALSDFSQVITDGPKVVSLANVFADADGDALTLTATSSDPGVATVSITGTDLTITPLTAGATTITVTANDGNGGTVQTTLVATFTAPVPVNNAPTVANALSDFTQVTTDGPKVVSLANVFADADGDALTLTVVSSNTGVATASITGTDLTITPLNAGATTVTVTANDGNGGTVQATLTATFTAPVPVNNAPTVANALSDFSQVITDGPKVVSLANVFADADGDALTLTATSSDPGVATVSITGTDLTITPLNAGATTVTVTANDGNGGTVQATLVATFTAPVPVNNAPTVANALSDFSQVVTDGPKVMSLANVFADADGDALTLTATTSDPGVATVSITGTDLTITPLNAGATTVTITANDGNGGTVQATLVATFTAPVPVNNAPTVANALSDFSQVVTDGPKVMSLANVFADADGDALTLTVVSSNTGVATASITGTDLTITPLNAGATTITVTANDGNGGTVQATLVATFTAPVPVNNAPTVANALSDFSQVVTDGPKVVSLANVFADADGDALTLTVVSMIPGVATASITGTDLTITPINAGATTVTVTANDGNGGTVQATLVATFTAPVAVNNAPTVANALSDFSQVVTDGPKVVSLANVFADADGDALTLTVVSMIPGVATASITGTDLTITPLNAGATTVTVTANDGNGGTVQATFTATFQAGAGNKAPVVKNALPSQTLNLLTSLLQREPLDEVLDISQVFEDEDGDALTVTADSSNPAVAVTVVTDSTLVVTPLGLGSTTITLTAKDAQQASATTQFTLTFQESGLFFSELVWGPDVYQFIELYNPTNVTLDSTKFRIKRSDGLEINFNDQYVIADMQPNRTFVLSDIFYDKYNDSLVVNSDTAIMLELIDEALESPIDLELYYVDDSDNYILLDKAVIARGHSYSRKTGTTIGRTDQYNAQDWQDKEASEELFDNLNQYGTDN